MKQRTHIAAVVLASVLLSAALAAGAGFWLGRHGQPAGESASATAAQDSPRKPLYYRNPMGLADTSPVPKKDAMGMDYIAVFAGDEPAAKAAPGEIVISTEKIQKLGVRTEAASMKSINKTIRVAGRIEADERHMYTVAPKFEGYVERLHVNASGQAVGKGQPLFEAYSPELVSAQREYAIAAQGVQALKAAGAEAQAGMQQLAESSLLRLKNWDISEEQIRALAKSGQARRTLTVRSPVAGIVMEKKALQGMRFMPGDALYQITDLSSVWVVADIFEQDIGLVRNGARARVTLDAYPGKVFEGTLAYVYPTLKTETRTMAVRIELANPGLLLKPGMFAQVELAAPVKARVLSVPASAVIDSGNRRIVLVATGAGHYAPREVTLGARSDDEVEVLSGLGNGEQVVVTANFLIDAESNLKAALSGFGTPASAATARSAAAGAVANTVANTAANAANNAAATPGAGAAPATAVGHKGRGKIEAIDVKGATLNIAHGPIASLQWPAMSMEFTVANSALLKGLGIGSAVDFEFVERKAGEWVITAIVPTPAAAFPAAAPPPPRQQHSQPHAAH